MAYPLFAAEVDGVPVRAQLELLAPTEIMGRDYDVVAGVFIDHLPEFEQAMNGGRLLTYRGPLVRGELEEMIELPIVLGGTLQLDDDTRAVTFVSLPRARYH
ncbi:MAG TPA: hypothetical protein VF171_04570 [Trueperaceae bacterium]